MGNTEVKIIKIIRIATEVGDGTPNNPYREGFEYWDTNGNLLFVTDE